MRHPLDQDSPVIVQEWMDERTRSIYQNHGLDGHNGIDFQADRGELVRAAFDGTVHFAGHGIDCPVMGVAAGNCVRLDHHIIHTGYAHLEYVYVKTGDTVKAGDVIGSVGMSGAATGYHLHWEVMGVPLDLGNRMMGRIDPRPYLNGTPLPVEDTPSPGEEAPSPGEEDPGSEGTPSPGDDPVLYGVPSPRPWWRFWQ